MSENTIATNRQARRDYTILETTEAGIELRGTEVKSLRDSRTNLKDSFARIDNNEAFVYNLHISPYEFGNRANVDPKRKRKLLLHKEQINRLNGQVSQKGLTLIPLKLYFKRGLVKMELALCTGKRQYDKREAIRKREVERELRRTVKNRLAPHP